MCPPPPPPQKKKRRKKKIEKREDNGREIEKEEMEGEMNIISSWR